MASSLTPVLDSLQYHVRFSMGEDPAWTETATKASQRYLQDCGYPALPKDWDWSEVVNTGEFRGTLYKRIYQYYYKVRGITCSEWVISGAITVGQNCLAKGAWGGKIWFDFDRDLAWDKGDFGDPNSCFFGGRKAAIDILQQNHSAAIRFWVPYERLLSVYPNAGQYGGYKDKSSQWYDDPDGSKWAGVGRAWIAESPALPPNSILIFNAYGKLGLEAISRVLLNHMGWKDVWKVGASNRGQTTGTLYMNGGAGFLLGKTRNVYNVSYVDLDFKHEKEYCGECGAKVLASQTEVVQLDGEQVRVCRKCFDALHFKCALCGNPFLHEDGNQCRKETYCTPCFERHLEVCVGCGDYVRKDSLRVMPEELHYRFGVPTKLCPKCVRKYVRLCNGCGKETDAKAVRCHRCGTHRSTSKYAIQTAKRNGTFGRKKDESKPRRAPAKEAVFG